ncbi:MAG: hypothetical protein A2X36_11295 [Elusimicrobia bacterium GWA2_69_24]|nr:MAG: hypothetical protein A2X36_11295 [Elusimicrobia bacterium GWA2_69_24]HBL17778.1 hypothetical protein [Elusimicrobiota bacterium]
MRAVILSLAACLAVAIAVYANSLHNPFVFDDVGDIVDNADIRKLDNLRTKLFAPFGGKDTPYYHRNDPSRAITYLTFTLNYHFGGLDPFGYHLFNMLLHALCACGVLLLARRITVRILGSPSVWIPLMAGLFFAAHPVNTEAVTYIYHRSEGLALLFFLAAFLTFDASVERKGAWLPISLACFALALLSKQTSATLPPMLLLYDLTVLSDCRWDGIRSRRWRHLAYWAVLAAHLAFSRFYLGGLADRELDAFAKWTRFSYLSIQPFVLLRYLQLLVFPSGLCIDHAIDVPRSCLEFRVWAPFVAAMASLSWLLAAFRRRTPDARLWAFCASWMLLGLAPTSSLMPILDAMADRRLYLPGFGFHLALAFAYVRVFRPEGKGSSGRRRIMIALAGGHILALGVATLARNRVYADTVLIWQDVVASYPRNHRAHNNLANAYYDRGDFDRALEHYRAALAIDPSYAGSYTNLGNIYLARGDDSAAFGWYQKAVAVNPTIAGLHVNLGNIYYRRGEPDRALAEFRQAARLDPNYAEARYSMGLALEAKKDLAAARAEYQAALDLKADLPDAHNNLGRLLFLAGRHAEAEQAYRRALALQPVNAGAHYNLGLLLEALGRREAALAEYRETQRLEPANAWAARRSEALGGKH